MRKILTASAISVLGLFLAAGNVFAATINNNGAGSHSTVFSTSFMLSVRSQTNISTFINSVNTSSNTGANGANFNTGNPGTVTNNSGGANTTVGVTNVAGSNVDTSSATSCCPCSLVPDMVITNNGATSVNTITSFTNCVTRLSQTNVSNVGNSITTTTNTGNNSASFNTGGNVTQTSGGATTTVNVTNVAGSNSSM